MTPPTDSTDHHIDEAVARANRQATEGPAALRQGRYAPDLAERFEADRRKPRSGR